jgi:hypothetical protein
VRSRTGPVLLAQHTLLAMRQMRSVLTANPDYREAADAELQDYTGELAGVVGGAYADAVAGGDAEARQQARTALGADAGAYGAWLAAASEGRVGAGDAAAVMRTHVGQLMDQVDAYAAKRFDTAQAMELEGYEQMLGVANTLVGALQRTVRPRLPVGGSQTGGDGTARRR